MSRQRMSTQMAAGIIIFCICVTYFSRWLLSDGLYHIRVAPQDTTRNFTTWRLVCIVNIYCLICNEAFMFLGMLNTNHITKNTRTLGPLTIWQNGKHSYRKVSHWSDFRCACKKDLFLIYRKGSSWSMSLEMHWSGSCGKRTIGPGGDETSTSSVSIIF